MVHERTERKSRGGVFLLAASAIGAAVYWLATRSRAAVEKVTYSVKRRDGRFEVREYPPLTVASARVREGGRERAFRRLFAFIDRGNTGREKIAMTAPVLIERDGEESRMSFVMPGETRTRSVPAPTDYAVSLGDRPPERVAVYRFPGRPTEDNERRGLGELREWMQARGLEAVGRPIVAYYDAPWLPPPLRRNEVMLRIRDVA
jgi:hypothetical protein